MFGLRPLLATACLLFPLLAAAEDRVWVLAPSSATPLGDELGQALVDALREGGWRPEEAPPCARTGACQDTHTIAASLQDVGDRRALLLVWTPAGGTSIRDSEALPSEPDERRLHVRGRVLRLVAPDRWTGLLEIDAVDGSDIWLDGAHLGRTPLLSPVETSPGQHRLRVRRGSGEARSFVEVRFGKTTRVRIEPRSDGVELVGFSDLPQSSERSAPATASLTPGEPERLVWPKWALLGAGVASVGLSIVPALQASDLYDEREALRDARGNFAPGDRTRQKELRQRYDANRDWSLVLLGTGGALLLGAGTLFALDLVDGDVPVTLSLQAHGGPAIAGRF